MKKMFLLSLCLIILIVAIPLPMVLSHRKNLTNTTDNSTYNTENITTTALPSEITEDADYIICEAMQYIDENDNSEVKKAVIALCKNNYIHLKSENPDNLSTEITKYSDSLYDELKQIYTQCEVSLLYENKIVYIPLSKTTDGYTVTDNAYPYILSIASPWDVLSDEYCVQGLPVNCGVSISGIKYICKNGADFTEALSWYLPNFDIKQLSTA